MPVYSMPCGLRWMTMYVSKRELRMAGATVVGHHPDDVRHREETGYWPRDYRTRFNDLVLRDVLNLYLEDCARRRVSPDKGRNWFPREYTRSKRYPLRFGGP